MAARNYRTMPGSRGNLLVNLGQQGVVYDNSKENHHPANKTRSKGKQNLNKTHLPKNGNQDIMPCFQNTRQKTPDCLPTLESNVSNIFQKTNSSDKISSWSDDIMSISVDDPELIDIISSIQKEPVNEKSFQSDVVFNQNSVQTINTKLSDGDLQISTSKEYPIKRSHESYIDTIKAPNESTLLNYFENFTENGPIEKERDNDSSCLQYLSIIDETKKNQDNPTISSSSITIEFSQELSQQNNQNYETDLETHDRLNSISSPTPILEETLEPFAVQNETCIEFVVDESHNSNDSMSILINKSPILNETADQEWIPENDDKPASDTDITDVESVESGGQNSQILDNEGNKKVKKNRKRKADPTEWNDIKNKKRRECGEAYQGWTKHKGGKAQRGAERAERKLGPACTSHHCQKTRDCQKITQAQRESIFHFFWKKMNWDQKKIYIASHVLSVTPKRRTTADGNTSRRQASLTYRLKIDENILKVCKRMFLSTLGLNEWMVTNWVKESKSGMSESTKERNTERQLRKTNSNANRKALEDFLDALPKLPSHYCRKSTSKQYLEPTFRNSMSEIYHEYVKKCTAKPLSRFTFDMVVREKNIGFQPPKKDRCDLCISYETGNADEEAYRNHIAKKERARDEKNKDKIAAEEGNCDVLTMDLQAVKICPSLNASALYYKTKLCLHNFTVYNINNHHCRCYWFDETEADLTANTFASCLIDYLMNTLSGRQVSVVIIWSDGCTYQNRNATLSNALLSFSVSKGITIYQKYLTKGHTQMEADSVHATIERKIKNKPIYLPSDYTRFTSEARRDPEPYEVKSLDFTFCRNYGDDLAYPSIRPGKFAGDPQVTDIVEIKYTPDGIISVKTNFDEELQNIPKKRGRKSTIKGIESFTQLHKQRIPIKKQKWLHLQQLKEVIPKDCHSFYDNLPQQ